MNRIYECMVLLDNREVRKGWDAAKDGVAGMMTKHGAEIVSSKLWEERKLAYPIKHQERGTYLLIYMNAPTSAVTSINREMEMADPVLRHVVVACEEVPETANEPEKEFDVSKIGQEPEPESAPAPEATEEAAATEAAPATEASEGAAEAAAEGEAAAAGEAVAAGEAKTEEAEEGAPQTPETKEAE